jgi:hypothetical protein
MKGLFGAGNFLESTLCRTCKRWRKSWRSGSPRLESGKQRRFCVITMDASGVVGISFDIRQVFIVLYYATASSP